MKLIFVMVITVLGLPQGNTARNRNRGFDCPSGWYRILESCIWFSHEKKNFDRAHEHCGQVNERGRLFEPKNRLQNDLVLTLLKNRQKEKNAWVGITDRIEEGKFRYMSSYMPIFFSKWALSEPSNACGTQHCVNFWFKDDSWDDRQCTNKFHYICEVPLNELKMNAEQLAQKQGLALALFGLGRPPSPDCIDSD